MHKKGMGINMTDSKADGSVVILAEMDTTDIRRGAEEIQKILAEIRSNAVRQFAMIRSSAVGEVQRALGQVQSVLQRMLTVTVSVISGGQQRIIGAARGVINNTLSDMLSQEDRFVTVGQQMMSGVSLGIRAASSGVYAAARRAAMGALDAMKDELGIHSPSQVMRDAVGMQIGAGLAQGMERNIPAVLDAAKTLADAAAESGILPDRAAVSSGGKGTGEGLQSASGSICSGGIQAMVTQAVSVLRRASDRTMTGQPMAISMQNRVSAGRAAEHNTKNSTAASRSNGMGGNTTIVFTKPVETPSAHAKALRAMMEEMLYGR